MNDAPQRLIAAIGNFDGVHLGHQRLLAETVAFAHAHDAAPGAVVFDPHPRRFFQPGAPAFLLTTIRQRTAIIAEAGVQTVMPLAFDGALAGLAPPEFVGDVLKRRLGLAGVVTGDDFRFGKGRAGDAAQLERLCADAGLAALAVAPQGDGAAGEKIGSSAIREAVAAGEMRAAAAMLGRPWAVEGPVVEGRKLGRTIGFATANLTLGPLIEPRRGVYAVRVAAKGAVYDGVANFGRRPTVEDGAPLLEAHLFDFEGDLYAETISVAMIDFIRDEEKFDGLDTLKAQIAKDCDAARALLHRESAP